MLPRPNFLYLTLHSTVFEGTIANALHIQVTKVVCCVCYFSVHLMCCGATITKTKKCYFHKILDALILIF